MSTVASWPLQAEQWLDERGKGAWIAAMILGFVIFWPVGLAILAYMIWSKRMTSCRSRGPWRHSRAPASVHARRHLSGSSGNAAFDAYKAETLSRLEEEQRNFEAFLKRLRDSKDKAEFDQFMEERARRAREARADADFDDEADLAEDDGADRHRHEARRAPASHRRGGEDDDRPLEARP